MVAPMKTKRSLLTLGAATLSLLSTAPFSQADPGDRTMVSVASSGEAANFGAQGMTLSGDGRFAAFFSMSSNLTADDPYTDGDIFVHDRLLRTTWLVTGIPSGGWATGSDSCISRDGRYVAFTTGTAMVASDTNGTDDVYVHDNQTGEKIRVSTTSTGEQAEGSSHNASFSGNGRYVLFESNAANLTSGDSNNNSDLFVKDLQTGTVTRASVSSEGLSPNGGSYGGAISFDGRFVAFTSGADNLVPNDKNRTIDVFIRDLVAGTNELISKSTKGIQGNNPSQNSRNSISDDGRFVYFVTAANNLFTGFEGIWTVGVRDRQENTTKPVGYGWYPHCDATGRLVVFPNGTPSFRSAIMLYDQLTGSTETISSEGSWPADGTISADGRIMGCSEIPKWTYGLVYCYTYEYGEPHGMTNFTLNRSVVAGQNTFTGTVTVNVPVGPSGAAMAVSSSSTLIVVPPSITIAPGLSSRTFVVKAFPVYVPKVESITVRWGTQSLSAPISLVPLVPSAFEFTPRPVIGGQPLTARLVMNGVAPSGGRVVALSDNSAFAIAPATVTVPAGSPQVVFTIQTLPVTSTKYVTVTAAVSQGSKTAHFVIRP